MGFQSQSFNDFFTKGFVVGEFKYSIKEFYDYDFPNCEDPNIGEEAGVPTQAESSLKFLQDQIAVNMISKVFTSFEHKANHNGGRRRVLSFEYFVEGIK